MTDFRDHLWHSTGLRIQRNNHIHFIHAGHGYNGVTIMDAFTFKQKLTAGIPVYDTYFRWKFARIILHSALHPAQSAAH